MSEVNEFSADLVDPKNLENKSQAMSAVQRNLSEKEIGKILKKKVEEATVLEDGSLYVVDPKFANDVVNKKYNELSLKTAIPTGIISLISAGSFINLSLVFGSEAALPLHITMSVLLGGLAPIITFGPIIEFLRVRKMISPSTIRKMQAKIVEWMKEQYDVEVSDQTAYIIAKSSLKYFNHEFIAKNGKTYRFNLFEEGEKQYEYEGWILEEKLPQVQQETHKNIAPKTSQRTVPSITTLDVVENVGPYSAEHQMFLDKVQLLKQQNLTSEDEHTLNRARQEAYSILQSAKLLKQLGDDTHKDSVVTAFTALNKELDHIIVSMLNHQRNELDKKKRIIEERTHAGVTLLKN